jgi:hypothetical protein
VKMFGKLTTRVSFFLWIRIGNFLPRTGPVIVAKTNLWLQAARENWDHHQ